MVYAWRLADCEVRVTCLAWLWAASSVAMAAALALRGECAPYLSSMVIVW